MTAWTGKSHRASKIDVRLQAPMLTHDLQEVQWNVDTPSVELTGGRHCREVTMKKTKMLIKEGERREKEEVWREKEWEGVGRGSNKPAKQEEAGRIAEHDP